MKGPEKPNERIQSKALSVHFRPEYTHFWKNSIGPTGTARGSKRLKA